MTAVVSKLPSLRGRWAQHVWVALALAVCNLALFLVVNYGNSYGYDQWLHVYLVSRVHSISDLGRPTALWAAYLSYSLLHVNHIAYHFVLIFVRSLDAYLLYLLVRQLAANQPVFAFAAGLCLSVFLIPDSYFIFTFLECDDNFTIVLLVLLALNLGVAYLLDPGPLWPRRSLALLLGLLVATVAVLAREAAAPLLAGVPVLVVLFKRAWSRASLAGLVAWVAVTVACGVYFVLPLLGVGPANYSTRNFQDLDVARMSSVSLFQLRFAFQNVVFLSFADLYEYRLPALLAGGVSIVVFLSLRLRLERCEVASDRPWASALVEFGWWLAIALVAAWLGLSAFLPTRLAVEPGRTRFLSAPGEAVALASGVWLLSHLARGLRLRRLLQLGGLAFVAICGAVTAGTLQSEVNHYAGNWENSAYFVRSLAHLVPEVEPPTLFVYLINPSVGKSPFAYGFSFQYGIRYFYSDQATGLIPTVGIFGQWSVSETGIAMQEYRVAQPHTYGWDEMIFLTRDDTGRLIILDRLPDKYYTEARQALYRPSSRIRPGFVSEQVQQTFPIVAGSDWSGGKTLLRHDP